MSSAHCCVCCQHEVLSAYPLEPQLYQNNLLNCAKYILPDDIHIFYQDRCLQGKHNLRDMNSHNYGEKIFFSLIASFSPASNDLPSFHEWLTMWEDLWKQLCFFFKLHLSVFRFLSNRLKGLYRRRNNRTMYFFSHHHLALLHPHLLNSLPDHLAE